MNLTNQADWIIVYEQGLSVLYHRDERSVYRYLPLKPVTVSVPSPVVHVLTDSLVQVPDSWRTAGWLEFEHRLFNHPNRYEDERHVRLNKGNLYLWQDLDLPLPYNLTMRFPYWLEKVRLTIRCYIDKSGRYISDPDIEKLREEVEGKTYLLGDPAIGGVTYATNSVDPTLVDSIFTINVPLERYQVGAFRDASTGRFVKNPYYEINPYRLTAIFTSKTQVQPGVITVDIGI